MNRPLPTKDRRVASRRVASAASSALRTAPHCDRTRAHREMICMFFSNVPRCPAPPPGGMQAARAE